MSQHLMTSESIVSLPSQQCPFRDRITVDFGIDDSCNRNGRRLGISLKQNKG
jgi:hypothetical protein